MLSPEPGAETAGHKPERRVVTVSGIPLMGCVLATRMAASERAEHPRPQLLGLEIAGTGRVPHPEAGFMETLTNPDLARAGREGRPPRSALRQALWTPDFLYPEGTEASLAFSRGPEYEGGT